MRTEGKRMAKSRGNAALKSAIGTEPDLIGTCERIDIIRALNWYNYSCEIKESRKWILDWMATDGYSKEAVLKYRNSSSSDIRQTWASVSRLLARGLHDEVLDSNLRKHIDKIIETPVVEKAQKPTERPVNHVQIELDTLLDQFYNSNYKKIPVIPETFGKGRTASAVKEVVTYCVELRDEIDIEQEGNNLTMTQWKKYDKLLADIIASLTATAVVVRRRKPRAKKPVLADKVVSKLKFLAEDKTAGSIDPKKILLSSVLWTFDTKKRKIGKYVAEKGMKLDVKGSSIKNFDPAKSYVKTIRKPSETIPLTLTQARVTLEKTIDKLTTKPGVASGRLNDQTLLLRVFK